MRSRLLCPDSTSALGISTLSLQSGQGPELTGDREGADVASPPRLLEPRCSGQHPLRVLLSGPGQRCPCSPLAPTPPGGFLTRFHTREYPDGHSPCMTAAWAGGSVMTPIPYFPGINGLPSGLHVPGACSTQHSPVSRTHRAASRPERGQPPPSRSGPCGCPTPQSHLSGRRPCPPTELPGRGAGPHSPPEDWGPTLDQG